MSLSSSKSLIDGVIPKGNDGRPEVRLAGGCQSRGRSTVGMGGILSAKGKELRVMFTGFSEGVAEAKRYQTLPTPLNWPYDWPQAAVCRGVRARHPAGCTLALTTSALRRPSKRAQQRF